MSIPIVYDKITVNNLRVEKHVCIDCDINVKKNLTVCGDLCFKGAIYQKKKPAGLLGFWALWPSDGGAGSKYGCYDCLSGARVGLPFNFVLADGSNGIKAQFNEGPGPCNIIFLYERSGVFIAKFDTISGIITYCEIFPNNFARAPIYDSVDDRFLAFDEPDGSLVAFDPITGAETNLTGGSGATTINRASDSVIINDTVFFFSLDNTVEDSDPWVAFNRITGAYLGAVNWSGNNVFTGTQFKRADDDLILGVGLDRKNVTIYFLIGGSSNRYLAYLSAATLNALEALLLSGNFDFTFTRNTPSDPLHALAFIN
jgi:hypothetical protein